MFEEIIKPYIIKEKVKALINEEKPQDVILDHIIKSYDLKSEVAKTYL